MKNEPDHPGEILIVDDTAENLRLLTSMLGQRGFKIRPAPSGRLALQAAERSAPDLVLLDINMPEMDGYEVCRQLKSRESLRDVPVIFLTALTETADKLKAFAAGGVDYISKPFQIDEVFARVKVHLALRRAQAELARNYQRLQELETIRDKLIHMVVHDMRSPLTVTMCNLELLKMSFESAISEKAVEIVDAAMAGLRGLTGMTNDLLDISKMEEGKMSLKRQPCDLTAMAGEVAKSISALDGKRAISVDGGESAKASCDIDLTRRIFHNLLSNAIKHTPDGSAVRVAVQEGQQHVRVSVIDAGPGVPVESRARIFEKFGVLETRTERKYHSVGLGLAFCKLAVEAHGGRIGVDSNEPQGSVFWFELPK